VRTAEVKEFALIGVGGYIAPRHLRAIKDTGNVLVAALDKSDSVGVIDSYFPEADFFTEFERFDRHLEKRRRKGQRVDFVTICSPNYLHDAHARFAMRIGADAICEKPLVLNPWNAKALQEIEQETGRRIFTILQLRLHPSVKALKEQVEAAGPDKVYDIDLTYITSRGKWYLVSWKGDISKSGGIATNIGVHFFDMLAWLFGPVRQNVVHRMEPRRAAGFIELRQARVRWFLSVEHDDLPNKPAPGKPTTYRSIRMDGREIDLSEGFTELHTDSYRQILGGNGFGIDEVIPSIEIVSQIRNAAPIGKKGEYHPMLDSIPEPKGSTTIWLGGGIPMKADL
jgi:UDP-N-acetyl-2-amino-2-deoxyglucuronate dehydrogenase